jgi:hypothetical protein
MCPLLSMLVFIFLDGLLSRNTEGIVEPTSKIKITPVFAHERFSCGKNLSKELMYLPLSRPGTYDIHMKISGLMKLMGNVAHAWERRTHWYALMNSSRTIFKISEGKNHSKS